MVIVNWTKNQVALFLGGSVVPELSYFLIGAGSSTVSVTDTTLVTSKDRQLFTSTTFPSTTKVKWQGDWSSVEMSGITLQEWGVIGSASTTTGSIWSRSVTPSVTFDGSNELRIEETWEVF